MTLTELKAICEFLDSILCDVDRIRDFIKSSKDVVIKNLDAKQRSVYVAGYCNGMTSAVTKITKSLGDMDGSYNMLSFGGSLSEYDSGPKTPGEVEADNVVELWLTKVSSNPIYKVTSDPHKE